MTSDTEINDLKNIGCDNCPAWYHLKCTYFAKTNVTIFVTIVGTVGEKVKPIDFKYILS